jgi:uncharacterized membrane protein
VGKPGPGQQAIHAKSGENSLSIYQSAIPSPEIAAGWEQACPGAADRILAMVEKELDNDRRIGRSECRRQTAAHLTGMFFGFVLCLAAMGGGVYLIAAGKNAQGLVALVSALVMVAASLAKGGR